GEIGRGRIGFDGSGKSPRQPFGRQISEIASSRLRRLGGGEAGSEPPASHGARQDSPELHHEIVSLQSHCLTRVRAVRVRARPLCPNIATPGSTFNSARAAKTGAECDPGGPE